MASQDYARKKSKKKQKKPAVAGWVMGFTLVISLAFVTGLVILSQQPDDPKAAPISVKKPTASETTKPEPKVQAEPKEASDNFDFYTLLPDSEVIPSQVEAYISTPKDPNKKTTTLLQAGSFRKPEDANRLRAQLVLLNLENVVAEKTVSSSGSVWYRVRLGPFDNRSALNKAEDILAQQGIASIRVNKSSN